MFDECDMGKSLMVKQSYQKKTSLAFLASHPSTSDNTQEMIYVHTSVIVKPFQFISLNA